MDSHNTRDIDADAVPKLGNQLCFALYSTMLAMNKVYRRLLKELDLTYPQYLVMLVLWEQDSQTVSDIGTKLFLESPTLTPLLKRLEAQGFVRRQRSTSDERQVIVSLTEAGKSLQMRAPAVQCGVAEALQCSLEEIGDLRASLLQTRSRLFSHA
ncbi:MarR family winged helix-turn-helix transcriptional regulator [Methyloversatilis thermotolerans]|uniref:MarR family winged helix-turn-helix transcriptional regulator n=1 Tax=Methyloversatilis thermotolerans TaxID=1346290 RepID=UPI00036CAD15|nr:MarR family transcriptional regulator [Methyloversatilis thermotolerans]